MTEISISLPHRQSFHYQVLHVTMTLINEERLCTHMRNKQTNDDEKMNDDKITLKEVLLK
jgi:hypothetical protein